MSVVTYIPQRLTINSMPLNTEFIKKKVCAYARVSTDTEEQQNSYEAQVDYYTRHIQANDKWEFVGVYADEGVTYGRKPKSPLLLIFRIAAGFLFESSIYRIHQYGC